MTTYIDWSEWDSLTPEQRVKRIMQGSRKRKLAINMRVERAMERVREAIAARQKALADCTHERTKLVVVECMDVRDRVLDDAVEERCENCKRVVRLAV